MNSYDIAEGINFDVNASVTYKSDACQYKRPEFWVAAGVFGDCEECNEEISEARLKAVPDCRLCINCAEREEKIRKQYRS